MTSKRTLKRLPASTVMSIVVARVNMHSQLSWARTWLYLHLM